MDNKVDHPTSNGPSRSHDLIVRILPFVSRRGKLTCNLELGGLLSFGAQMTKNWCYGFGLISLLIINEL